MAHSFASASPGPSLTATLMAAKKAKGLSFADLEAAMGLDEVWIASLFYGQAAASAAEAEQLAGLLDLSAEIAEALQAYPTKGCLDPVLPTDPLIYRFYEIMQVYGLPLKDSDSREIRRWHHERHRLHPQCGKNRRPRRRSRPGQHVWQVPALQEVVIAAR